MLRDDQLALLRWVLEAVDGTGAEPLPPLPELDLPRLQAAGVATGLTAAVGALVAARGLALPDGWREFVGEQTDTVAGRHARYRHLLPLALRALDDAGVAATPVKGAVIADALWPVPAARPMADIDLLVRPAERAVAVRALVAAGMRLESRSPDEDVLLAWGDGSTGATDRESAGHNGKVEIHPGWSQRVHHYAIDGGDVLLAGAVAGELTGAPCRLLRPHALALHALGHLSVGVIRAEVRAVNVVDVALALQALDTAEHAAFRRACAAVDPRLVAPGLWLVCAVRPTWFAVPSIDDLLGEQCSRLPAAAVACLATASPADVLRQLGARTSVRWRLAFATTAGERAAVLRQAVSPTGTELATAAGGSQAMWRLQLARVRRAVARATGGIERRSRAGRAPGPVVYVLAGDPGGVAPAETLTRWPTAGRTLGALRRGGVDVVGVARTSLAGERLEHEGVEWWFVHDRSRSAHRIALAVRRHRPRVVHVNGIGFSLAWLAIRAACPRTPIVVQHHGERPGAGASLRVQRLVRRVVQGYLFTGGADQAAPFVAAGVLAADTPVVDVLEASTDIEPVDRDAARRRTGVSGAPAVVAVGRLVDAKDPVVLASVFCAFAAEAPAAELWWLYHDDHSETAVRAVLTEHPSVAARVHLVGRVGQAEVGAWLSAADVFLSASRHEGSGYALIEAIRCGCTPVVSDIAPHRAIAGPIGIRFPPGDVTLGAAALHDVVLDPQRAHDRFVEALTWAAVAAQLRAVYDQW